MSDFLAKAQSQGLTRLIKKLCDAGFETRYIGGAVRDKYLGLEPADYDLATAAKPDILCDWLNENNYHFLPTGIEYGTITVLVAGCPIQMTSLRRDILYINGRHPEVEYCSDFKEDAARRDFTMNAMSMDLEGKIYDYFGGRADLDAGVLRFIGQAEDRINEDPLRLLRYFRFLAKFPRLRGEESTLNVTKLAPLLLTLKAERIRMELKNLCEQPGFGDIWMRMEGLGIFSILWPNFQRTPTVLGLMDLVAHASIPGMNEPYLGLMLCILLGSPDEDREDMGIAIRLSRRELHLLIGTATLPDIGGLKSYSAWVRFMESFGVEDIDFFSFMVPFWQAWLRITKDPRLEALEKLLAEETKFHERRVLKLPISGDDLSSLAEGRELGLLLAKVRDSYLDGKVGASREELLRFAEEVVAPHQ